MPKRTIGIDTRWLESKVAAAGTNTYITSLMQAMLQLDAADSFVSWGTTAGFSAGNLQHKEFTGYYRRAWQLAWKTLGWPPADPVLPKADLWHFTNYVAPPTGRPFVLTVYDLSFVDHPEFTEPTNLRYLERHVPDSLARADQVITISQHARDGLIEHFDLAPQKVKVTHLAADERFTKEVPEEEVGRIKDKYGIEGEYLLAVGTLEPRKNLKNLLMAMAGLRRSTTEQLVVVGGQGWLFDETQQLLTKLGLGSRVVLTGYVPSGELPGLYQGAKAFVFPSFYEGFGLPLLEAMHAGTPVVCSNTSSLPEVAGGAALYFDPADVKGMKLALERVLNDENLRNRLSEAGRDQAAQFSWDKTAKETLDIYHNVLNA